MLYASILTWLANEKAAAFAIVSGVVGFLAKAIYDLWAARRKERLDRVNQQLKLFYGPLLPDSLQLFCAHVAAHKVVFERWSKGDFREHASVLNYPTFELGEYLERSFLRLKSEQARLIGR